VSPGWLAAAGVPVLRGRDVSETDREGSPPVAVVNETFARRHWPGQDPIGRRFRILGGVEGVRVVGVSRDTLVARVDEPPQPVAYMPLEQSRLEVVTLAASGPGDDAALLVALEKRVGQMDAGLVPYDASTIEAALARGLWAPRAMASLLLLFGALALVLSSVGLYGLVAQTVAQRTPEIGLRMALGATSGSIRGLVLKEGARLLAVGLPAGLALSGALARFLSGSLYGVGALDPPTFAGVAAVLVVATTAACLIPAQRAITVDPGSVLK
jgi:hypothetical protein